MLIVRIQGGLGNQLSSYAFGRAVAKYIGCDMELDVGDFSFRRFDDGSPYFWPYFLDQLNVPERIRSKRDELVGLLGSQDVSREYGPQIFEEIKKNYDLGRKCLDSLGADWRYHEPVIDDLREQLNPLKPLSGKNKEIYEEILGCESVGVHFRLGDYVTNQNCFVLPVAFQQGAVLLLGRMVANLQTYVFTDSPEFLRGKLQLHVPYTLVDWNDKAHPVEDMMLFSACKHKVLANSSFSFWAARLSRKTGGHVLCPETYHNPNDRRLLDQHGVVIQPHWPPEWRPLQVNISPEYQRLLDSRGNQHTEAEVHPA